MPIMPKKKSREDLIVAARESFCTSHEWRRAKSGNLWRRFNDPNQGEVTLSVYPDCNDPDLYRYCVVSAEGKYFSEETFDDEEAAVYAIAEFLFVGE